MKIDVRINSVMPNEGNLKAIASANLDDCFAVKNIKVVEGKNGLFVSMPSYKGQDGEYHDLCFPTTSELRKQLIDAILEAYRQTILQFQRQSVPDFSHVEQAGQMGQVYEAAPTFTM